MGVCEISTWSSRRRVHLLNTYYYYYYYYKDIFLQPTQLSCMSDDGWEKILWKDQRYPDNYIPERYFLSSLRKNRMLK